MSHPITSGSVEVRLDFDPMCLISLLADQMTAQFGAGILQEGVTPSFPVRIFDYRVTTLEAVHYYLRAVAVSGFNDLRNELAARGALAAVVNTPAYAYVTRSIIPGCLYDINLTDVEQSPDGMLILRAAPSLPVLHGGGRFHHKETVVFETGIWDIVCAFSGPQPHENVVLQAPADSFSATYDLTGAYTQGLGYLEAAV